MGSLQNCVVVVLFLTKSCLTLCSPMDSSPPGSSVHGTSQARIPEWVVISFFRGSSQPRDVACISCISCIGRQIFYHWATRKHQNCQRIYFYWLKPQFVVICYGSSRIYGHFYHHKKIWTALWAGKMDSVMLLECISLYGEDVKTLTQTSLVRIRQLLSTQLWKALLGWKTAHELFPAFLTIRPPPVFQRTR